MKTKIIIFLILNVFGVLLATLGNISSPILYGINYFWPAAVIQIVGAILFGWTGVLAGAIFPVLSNLLTNLLTDQAYFPVLGFFVPCFVQSYLAFYLFRKLNCDITLKGWRSILLFSLVVTTVPAACGGLLGSFVVLLLGNIVNVNSFIRMTSMWFTDGVPWAIIFGIPIIKIFAPILKEYGLLFGQPKINKILINEHVNKNEKKLIKNLPIFLKIFSSFFLVGVIPVSVLGTYEIIISKAHTTEFNINSVFTCFGFFASLILTGTLTNAVISPIKKLSHGIGRMAAGDFDHKVEVYSDDELGKLAVAFNNMSQTVKDNIHQKEIYMQKVAENEKLAIIGSTTTMVAHDIRRPLNAMKGLLNVLPEIKDAPNQLDKMIIDLDVNITRTNSILNDILEFSNDVKTLKKDRCNPQSIITSSLSDGLRAKEGIEVQIEYNLEHKNFLNIDSDRIIRVFSNIISNAVEAMNNSGKIWFKTKDKILDQEKIFTENEDPRMIIVIGNNGSFIPNDLQYKVFDPFFTYNKKDGTGLGLAICKKIIEMHKGTIKISSEDSPNKFVEFIMELPVSEGNLKVKNSELIHHSDELLQFRKEETIRKEYGDTRNTSEFLRIHKEKERELNLLVLDDDSLFRKTIKTLLKAISQVRDHVKIFEADNGEYALKLFDKQQIDYVIADLDLGKTNMTGYEFTKVILEKYPGTYIVINSNKRRDEMDEDIRENASPYFMGFLPKPMKQSELLQFLACKTFEITDISNSSSNNELSKETVLILNDDATILESIKIMVEVLNLNTITAASVDEAIKRYESNKIDLVISDINLGKGEKDGYELVKWIRDKDNKIPIYMISGYTESQEKPKALKAGASGYYQLPIEEKQIKEIVTEKPVQANKEKTAEGVKPSIQNEMFENFKEVASTAVHDMGGSIGRISMVMQLSEDISDKHKKTIENSLKELKAVRKNLIIEE